MRPVVTECALDELMKRAAKMERKEVVRRERQLRGRSCLQANEASKCGQINLMAITKRAEWPLADKCRERQSLRVIPAKDDQLTARK